MNQTEPKPALVKTMAASRYLGIPYSAFTRLVAAKAIKPIPGTKLFRVADLDRLAKGQEVPNDAS